MMSMMMWVSMSAEPMETQMSMVQALVFLGHLPLCHLKELLMKRLIKDGY